MCAMCIPRPDCSLEQSDRICTVCRFTCISRQTVFKQACWSGIGMIEKTLWCPHICGIITLPYSLYMYDTPEQTE